MSPEVEAHKVLAISFGKIADSRIQRGGPKLYKNLLVANLINKARVLFTDTIPTSDQTEYEQEQSREGNEDDICPPERISNEENPNEVKPLLQSTPELSLGKEEEEDHPMQQGCEVSQNNEEGNLSNWDESNKENRPSYLSQEPLFTVLSKSLSPVSPSSKISSEDPATGALTVSEQKNSESVGNDAHPRRTVPLRCLKRRNHTSEDDLHRNTKRHKITEESKFKDWRTNNISSGFSDTESDTEDSYEHKIPAQVNLVFSVELRCEGDMLSSTVTTTHTTTPMETEQITNLTSVFNSSFHGLGTHSQKNSNFKLDLCTTRSNELETKTTSNAELVVCSKQAASIFKVTFPSNKTLALTV